MPAALVPDEAIPQLAAHIDSPARLRALWRLQRAGFIQNGQDVDEETRASLQQLAALGLVDPGYAGPTDGQPFVWVSNSNGERVVQRFEANLTIHPRARTALASLSEADQLDVLAAVAVLQGRDPISWHGGEALKLSPDEPVYLLRVSPDLRALLRVLDSGRIELLDVIGEGTLRLFLERYRAGSKAG